MCVEPGQHVREGDALAIVRVSDAELDRRRYEESCLRAEIKAAKERQLATHRRLAQIGQITNRVKTSQASLSEATDQYVSIRDGLCVDYTDRIIASTCALNLLEDDFSKIRSAHSVGAASLRETTEAELDVMLQRITNENLHQAWQQIQMLEVSLKRVSGARAVHFAAMLDLPSAEQVDDLRLLDQLDEMIHSRETKLKSLLERSTEYVLRAPHSGIVLKADYMTGVNAGDPVCTVADPSSCCLKIQIDYETWEKIRLNDEQLAFRVVRTGQEGIARAVFVRRGIIERDRRLNRISLIEIIADPTQVLEDPVPDEQVVILE